MHVQSQFQTEIGCLFSKRHKVKTQQRELGEEIDTQMYFANLVQQAEELVKEAFARNNIVWIRKN